ncbi:MAG: preprotein translocase subunit SecG [Patescibacteria group bacterium]
MILFISNIVLSVLIVTLILLQGRGAGLGSAWGGSGDTFQTRRGPEKLLFQITIVCIVCFFIVSALNLVL